MVHFGALNTSIRTLIWANPVYTMDIQDLAL